MVRDCGEHERGREALPEIRYVVAVVFTCVVFTCWSDKFARPKRSMLLYPVGVHTDT